MGNENMTFVKYEKIKEMAQKAYGPMVIVQASIFGDDYTVFDGDLGRHAGTASEVQAQLYAVLNNLNGK